MNGKFNGLQSYWNSNGNKVQEKNEESRGKKLQILEAEQRELKDYLMVMRKLLGVIPKIKENLQEENKEFYKEIMTLIKKYLELREFIDLEWNGMVKKYNNSDKLEGLLKVKLDIYNHYLKPEKNKSKKTESLGMGGVYVAGNVGAVNVAGRDLHIETGTTKEEILAVITELIKEGLEGKNIIPKVRTFTEKLNERDDSLEDDIITTIQSNKELQVMAASNPKKIEELCYMLAVGATGSLLADSITQGFQGLL